MLSTSTTFYRLQGGVRPLRIALGEVVRTREKGMAEKEKLDFLTRLRLRELVLMGLIAITAVLANLPEEYVEETLGVSRATLVAVLGIAVIIGLFLYLRTGLFIA